MVRWRVRALALALAAMAILACRKEREMADTLELPDSMEVERAMNDAAARDALLDSMPGGEMARGDSTSEMELLKKKM